MVYNRVGTRSIVQPTINVVLEHRTDRDDRRRVGDGSRHELRVRVEVRINAEMQISVRVKDDRRQVGDGTRHELRSMLWK